MREGGAILVVIDGCRGDAIRAAKTPNLNELTARGSHTFQALTVRPSTTLPVHFSIFSSLPPELHGVEDNEERPCPRPAVHTIVQRAREEGLRTCAFYNWEHLRELSPPGTLDHAVFMDNARDPDGDGRIAKAAGDYLTQARPRFAFVYLGCLDEIGHRRGFMSPAYLEGLGRADEALGILLDVLEQACLLQRYHFVVQSDHGGAGRDHRRDCPEVTTVPWIAAGPDILRGRRIRGPVSVLDTAPTLARMLGIPPHSSWKGRVVDEIFA